MWCYHSSIANLGLTFLNRLQFTDFSGCWVSEIVSALGFLSVYTKCTLFLSYVVYFENSATTILKLKFV